MKMHRPLTFFTAILLAVMIITSCSAPEDNLPGTWITESVSVSVDSTKANLASIDATVVSTKSMIFTLNDDHTMSLSIDGYTSDAFWNYNSSKETLTYRLGADIEEEYELGKLEGDKIIYTGTIKYGTITSVHVKK